MKEKGKARLDLRHLSPDEHFIFNHFVRCLGYCTHKDISWLLGVSKQRILQIESKALAKLRAGMADELREHGLAVLIPIKKDGSRRGRPRLDKQEQLTNEQRWNQISYERRKERLKNASA